ncbi:MAG: DUF1573 domain-containing protein [Chloroflexota bacterium]|jgi:hypothetical protein
MGYRGRKPARAQRQARSEKQIIWGIVVISGLLLFFGVAYAYWSGGETAAAPAFTYEREDVVVDRPITAVHDMGQGPEIPFLPADGPQPQITISEHFYNFGSIGPNEVVQRTFAVRNDGDAPLTISRAYTTCGCTIAEISASVIPPGKVAEVTLIFDAGFHDSRGQTVRRGIIIENNDPRQPQVEIWVQANVRFN